ncbi:glycoside hydrolase family 43 protein [Neolewinella xylanilytica]|uniref:glycoside hydrolase family 43 protein n=1 Tax=Neolewinella xylanilytica TaxID=1514080 RepID=UPI001FEC297A|nr:glycoside hydrolase 43 family protein [Neolewinella xylanilytica]
MASYPSHSFFILLLLCASALGAQSGSADTGDATYSNPILHADYSDPDVVRVGDDFYLTASSFNAAPGLPILHSRDLVNWELINHAIDVQVPLDTFARPQHGNGVWAPAIRYHDGYYYIYYGDPDFGIYMVRTDDPAGEWEEPVLVRAAKGWIDPCPFWDDDGKAYLVHAFAGSRAGMKSVVVLHEMSPDGTELLDDGVLVFDGHEAHGTIEGTKMHKRDGYYYILAPAGGVSTGWQTVLRSKNIYGPYEDKIVLDQGETDVNGPHQGAWVELENGDDWFVHFQEKQPYGRIVHLQPARWESGWLMIGTDRNGDGIGEPVSTYAMPKPAHPVANPAPATDDEFNDPELGLQWQWQANPKAEWAYPTAMGFLRLNLVVDPGYRNLWDAPHLLLTKLPAASFTTTTKVTFYHHFDSEQTGLIMMGRDYAYIALTREGDDLVVKQVTCEDAENGAPETTVASEPINTAEVYLRVNMEEGGACRFSYSIDGTSFTELGEVFQAREGKWIGAKMGLFATRDVHQNDGGYANYDWFRTEE